MSEYIKTLGLVIKQHDVGEADRALVVLTKECGKINLWVNGARRAKSKNLATSQLFCASDFVVFKKLDTYKLKSSEVVEPFFNLRKDLDRLTFATYLVKLTNDGIQEGCEEGVSDIIKLLLNCLHFIANTDKNPELVVHIFEIRFLSIIGFEPHLNEDGMVEAGHGTMRLSESAQKAIQHILKDIRQS